MKNYEEAISFLKDFSFEEFEKTEKCNFWKDYLNKVKRMSGAGILEILNKSVSFMDEDAAYLEIGIHQGCTLVGASIDNETKDCYGIDPFTGHCDGRSHPGFNSVEEGLIWNIENNSPGNISYWKETFQEFLKDKTHIRNKKVQVLFSDGDHSKHQTKESLIVSQNVLDDKCIVVLDDTHNNDKGNVQGAIFEILEEYKEFELVKDYGMRSPNHEVDWCGCMVLSFDRSRK